MSTVCTKSRATFRNPPPCCPALVHDSFEIDEEQVIESNTGAVKRTKVSLGESGQLDGYVLVSKTIPTNGRSLIQVEARQLAPGGHFHTQVKQ